MYKILITTKHSYNGAAVHTVVVEFADKAGADKACAAVNSPSNPASKKVDFQSAMPLY